MGDTLRTIVKAHPAVLRKNKQITWERILELGSWDALLDDLAEAMIYEFGWLSASDKLNYFNKKFGLDLSLSREDRSNISSAELLRHLIMHNGGRISAEHIRRTGNTALKLGDIIPVDHDEVSGLSFAIRRAASDIFVAVSEAIFKKKDSDVKDIPRFEEEADNE